MLLHIRVLERKRMVQRHALALLIAYTTIGCPADVTDADCRTGRLSLEFATVRTAEDCDGGCTEIDVPSDAGIKTSRILIGDPRLEVDACSIDRILVANDGVALSLDAPSRVRFAQTFQDSDGGDRADIAVLLQIDMTSEFVSLLRHHTYGRIIPLFDLRSAARIEEFIAKVDRSDVVERLFLSVRDDSFQLESPATESAAKLLDRAARVEPLWDRLLALARDGKTDTEEYKRLVEQIESMK